MIRKIILGFITVLLCLGIVTPLNVQAASVQTEVSKYALSWADNKNIPYVYGGKGRNMNSLEEVAEAKAGLDCSGFTALVYKHFGIDIPMQSSLQKKEAKKVFTNIEEAVPGDVVWWNGHVAIYIGDEKICHTNTSKGPTNYPHVSSVYYNTKEKPTFLRMVDDVSALKPLSGSDADSLSKDVESSKLTGSIVTESDLTGMPTESSLLAKNQGIPDITELSDEEKKSLVSIKENVDGEKDSWYDTANKVVVFVGIVILVYGLFLGVAFMFDRTNVILDVSLLAVLTLGRYRVWDEMYGVPVGYSSSEGIMYCDGGLIFKRIVVIEIIGFFLVSGGISRIIYDALVFIFSLWK